MAFEKLGYRRTFTADRKGDGAQFQMFGGGATVDGNTACYDADGNVVDGGVPVGGYIYVAACWVLARGVNAGVAADLANPVPVCLDDLGSPGIPVEFLEAHAIAGTPPTGDDLIIDINLNGASIFGATKLVIPDGSAVMNSQATFDLPAPVGYRGDVLKVDIDNVGSVDPGKDITVVLRMRY